MIYSGVLWYEYCWSVGLDCTVYNRSLLDSVTTIGPMLTLLYIDSTSFVLSVCLWLTWSVIEWLLGPLLWWRRSFSILLIVPFPLWAIFFTFSAVRQMSSSEYCSTPLNNIWKLLAFTCYLFSLIPIGLLCFLAQSLAVRFVHFLFLYLVILCRGFSFAFPCIVFCTDTVHNCALFLSPCFFFLISEVDITGVLISR